MIAELLTEVRQALDTSKLDCVLYALSRTRDADAGNPCIPIGVWLVATRIEPRIRKPVRETVQNTVV